MRNNLKKERELKSLSREKLAKILNISEVYVRKLESGTSNPSLQMAKEFAEFYRKPLDYLFPDLFLLSFDTKRIKNNKEVI
ncbi:helix-turn-helix transcriptional regulator [Enterococcus sp. DIV0800]|uniref:helix-turn-helix transcriptional regulator n=1 Tax=unclassified Enterococcus TaxID=2608891 RepID=UPI003D2FB6D4